MENIKKNQGLMYKFFNGYEELEIRLKVIHKEKIGSEIFAKCKVMSKGWYSEVYLGSQDLFSGKVLFLK